MTVAESAPQADIRCLRYSYNSRPIFQLIQSVARVSLSAIAEPPVVFSFSVFFRFYAVR